ncbi:MAG: hypothetical protein ACXWZS_04985, partial [Gemmatirosa sp.]
EALTILAALSIEVGEFTAALRSCQSAMTKSPRPHMHAELLRYLVQAFIGLGDDEAARSYLPVLEATVRSTPNPWQEAQGRRVLGEAFAHWNDKQTAMRYLQESREISQRGGYAELIHLAEQSLARCAKAGNSTGSGQRRTAAKRETVGLDEGSQTVIDQLSCLAVA